MTDSNSLTPPSSTQELLKEAERQVVKWRRRRRYTIGISGLLALSPLFIFMVWHPPASSALAAHLMVDPLFFGLLGLLVGYLMRPTRRNPLNQLWNAQEVEAIGPLAESLQMVLPEISVKAIPALLRLLPLVNEHNTPHLTAYQRTCLQKMLGGFPQEAGGGASITGVVGDAIGAPWSVLAMVKTIANAQSSYDPQLAEAILYAYIYMGNRDDLRVVERLARPAANPLTQTVASAALQKVAQDVLPLLAESVKQQEAQEVSLRPASAPLSDTATLLQPAHGPTSQPVAELLRADLSSPAVVAQETGKRHPTYAAEEAQLQEAIPLQNLAS